MLTAARAQWEGFQRMLARSTCSACDRAEFGYQIAEVSKKINLLTENLKVYDQSGSPEFTCAD